MVTSGIWEMSAVAKTLFLVLLITVFMQLEGASYRRKLNQSTDGPRRVRLTAAALKDVQRFLLIKVALSIANGVLLGLWCWVWGVPSPLLWGVVAFALNFIPFVGSVLAAVPPVLLALVDAGVGGAFGVLAGYLLVNIILDNILEPRLMGRALGLSPLVALLSMLLWGFLLGGVGALLSVPLTMAVKIVLSHSEGLRWVAVLLGDARSLPPAPAAEVLPRDTIEA
jgi:predicted PurR-regulated permease PerM